MKRPLLLVFLSSFLGCAHAADKPSYLSLDTPLTLTGEFTTIGLRRVNQTPLTRDMCLAVVASLKDSVNAHFAALSFQKLMLESFTEGSSPETRAKIKQNLDAMAESSIRTVEALKLWQERADQLKD